MTARFCAGREHDERPSVLGGGLTVDGADDGAGSVIGQTLEVEDHLAQGRGLLPSQPLALGAEPMQRRRHVDKPPITYQTVGRTSYHPFGR
jgi:hypothetical protein